MISYNLHWCIFPSPFFDILQCKRDKQIRRITVHRAATNLTLKKVKDEGQGQSVLPIDRACHRTMYAKYQCSIINILEDMIQV